MLISEKHRLVFVHIHKTAGSSVAEALASAAGVEVNTYRGERLHNHASMGQLLARFPSLSDYFCCCIVRNPWDRLLSYYHWIRNHVVPEDEGQRLRKQHMMRYSGFSDYVRDLHRTWSSPHLFDPFTMRPSPDSGAVNYRAQWTWVRDEDDLLVDYVGRFESLQNSMNDICRAVGLLPTPLHHLNQSSHRSYDEYYDPDTIAMVNDVFAKDVELFGYPVPSTGGAVDVDPQLAPSSGLFSTGS